MKENIKDYLTKFLWILIFIGFLFIAGTLLSPEVKGTNLELVDKNPSLKKYKQKQKQMQFKGFKKRKGKFRVR